jgi:hypothetical protein
MNGVRWADDAGIVPTPNYPALFEVFFGAP